MFKRDYVAWHKKKELLEKLPRLFFHEREVWWCHLGANIGFEEDGKNDDFLRPILIFKKFNNESLSGTPLTTQAIHRQYYASFSINGVTQYAILSQMRLLGAKCVLDEFGVATAQDYGEITKMIVRICNRM